MKKSIITLFCFLIAAMSLMGQGRQLIEGRVWDKGTQKGIAYAVVGINLQYAYADENGRFSIEVPVAEAYKLEAGQLGYETAKLSLQPGDNLRQVDVQVSAQPVQLQEILVSERPRHCNPQSNVYCDAMKQVSQPRDVGDLFGDIPGFGLIKKGGFALDPVFRSFKYEQLNVIYDGGVQPTHACPARMDPVTTHVDPEDVKKIELIKGPFSVRHGMAMGATINVVTQENMEAPAGVKLGGTISSGYETNGNSWLTRLGLRGANRIFDAEATGGYKNFGSYSSGNGTLVPSSFRGYDYSLKAGYRPSEDQRLQLSWRQAFSRDVLHPALAMDTDIDDTYIFSADYTVKNIGPKFYGLALKGYGTRVNHVMSNLRRPNAPQSEMVSTVVADNYGARAEATLMPNAQSLLYVGADYRYLWRDGSREALIKMINGMPLANPIRRTDAIWQNASIHDAGVFAEGRWFLGDRWTLMAGFRTDFVSIAIHDPAPDFEAKYENLDVDNEWNISANATLNYQMSKGWSTQLAIGRGMRTATMIERFINHFSIGVDPYEYVGNPHLRPEANHQAEWSLNHQQEHFAVSASVFGSLLSNYITAAVDSTLPRKYMGAPAFARRFVNIDKAMQAGMELSAQVELVKYLQLNGSLAYTYAQNLDWNEPLAEIPPLTVLVGLRYQRARWWADVRGRFADQQDRVSVIFDESETPGFSVFDLRAGVEPLKGLNMGFAVLNVFDRQYREHLNRAYRNQPAGGIVWEPGRNATFFVKYKF